MCLKMQGTHRNKHVMDTLGILGGRGNKRPKKEFKEFLSELGLFLCLKLSFLVISMFAAMKIYYSS